VNLILRGLFTFHRRSPEPCAKAPYREASTESSFSGLGFGFSKALSFGPLTVAAMKSGNSIRSFSAKDGRQVVLRTIRWEDLDDLLELINCLVEEKADIVRTERVSREEEVDWLCGALSRLEKDDECYIVAEVSGKVVANSEVSRGRGYEKHVGGIGIAIKDGFRDIGIGTEMIKALIDQARRWGLKVLTLRVFASNRRAFHLYEKVGFVQTGVIPKKLFRDDEYIDEVIMTKLLE
jgi:RimJ/RimL family protein N-acetyltransferase